MVAIILLALAHFVTGASAASAAPSAGRSASAVRFMAASAAATASPAIEVSLDGEPFARAPFPALFPSDYRISPGDRLSRGFEVRSTHGMPVVLTVTANDVRADDESLVRDLSLAGGEGDAAGEALSLSSLPSCAPLIEPRVVQPGEVVPVTVVLELDRLSTNTTQMDSLAFDIEIGLTDVGVPVDPSGCAIGPVVVPGIGGPGTPAPSAEQGPLASTGGTLPYPVLLGAGLAMGVGWLLVVDALRRRRRGD
jgi:hypothetical protein